MHLLFHASSNPNQLASQSCYTQFTTFKMKATIFTQLVSLAAIASATPTGCDFSLVGFGKDNPIGPTTGGKGGKTVTVTSQEALVSAVAGDVPTIVVAKGNFNLTKRLLVGNNKSLIGFGKGAEITGSGISVVNKTNVIIRNLGIRFILDNDGITIQNSTRVWIDHNEFSSDLNNGPDYYDGQCDIVSYSSGRTAAELTR